MGKNFLFYYIKSQIIFYMNGFVMLEENHSGKQMVCMIMPAQNMYLIRVYFKNPCDILKIELPAVTRNQQVL